jgi:hypothetical protein
MPNIPTIVSPGTPRLEESRQQIQHLCSGSVLMALFRCLRRLGVLGVRADRPFRAKVFPVLRAHHEILHPMRPSFGSALTPLFAMHLMLSACAPAPKPFDPSLQQRQVYLCCNLWFNEHLDATDANYAYGGGLFGGGPRLNVGTEVRIFDVGPTWVSLLPVGDPRRFTLHLRYARDRLSPREYFRQIFLDVDPTPTIAGMPQDIRAAIADGRLVRGMTKEQATRARGYPQRIKQQDSAVTNGCISQAKDLLIECASQKARSCQLRLFARRR